MKEFDEERKSARQYLLGDVDDEQRSKFEQRLLADPSYFERVLMLEGELFDDFVFKVLPEDEQEKVVRHLLSTPEQMRKLEFTKLIDEYARRPVAQIRFPQKGLVAFLSEHKSVVGLSLAATLILVVAVGFWALRGDSLTQELALLNNVNDATNRTASDANGSDPSLYSINLHSRRFRGVAGAGGDEETKVVIPVEARVVQLRIPLTTDDAQGYRVELEKDDGQKVFTLDNLRAEADNEGKLLTIKLPARILNRGYYQLMISKPGQGDEQFEDVGSYNFQIINKE